VNDAPDDPFPRGATAQWTLVVEPGRAFLIEDTSGGDRAELGGSPDAQLLALGAALDGARLGTVVSVHLDGGLPAADVLPLLEQVSARAILRLVAVRPGAPPLTLPTPEAPGWAVAELERLRAGGAADRANGMIAAIGRAIGGCGRVRHAFGRASEANPVEVASTLARSLPAAIAEVDCRCQELDVEALELFVLAINHCEPQPMVELGVTLRAETRSHLVTLPAGADATALVAAVAGLDADTRGRAVRIKLE
jgi:hypothetical protein